MITEFVKALRRVVEDDSAEAKKEFNNALNLFVDYRVKTILEDKRSSDSQEHTAVAATINASAIKYLGALNSAPIPPDDIDNKDDMEIWVKAYRNWYEQRKESMDVK